VLPCILLTPTLKIIIIYSTVLNQLVTLTTGGTFDPKKTTLIGFNGSTIITEKRPNDYDQNINQWIEQSPYKDIFRPRASVCVHTILNDNGNNITIVSNPIPFDDTCVNKFEWAILSLSPCFIMIILSLFYFIRKVCYLCAPKPYPFFIPMKHATVSNGGTHHSQITKAYFLPRFIDMKNECLL